MSEENRKIVEAMLSDNGLSCAGLAKALDEAESRGEDQGANLAAFKLREIAETGEHTGTFGGPEIEKAAQAILKAISEAKKSGYLSGHNDGYKQGMERALPLEGPKDGRK